MESNIYLYDYQIDQNLNEIYLFGINESCQKQAIILKGYELYIDVAFDDCFTEIEDACAFLKQIPVQTYKKKSELLSSLIQRTRFVDRKPFKGYHPNPMQLIRVSFETMQKYEQFKRSIFDFNVLYESQGQNFKTEAERNESSSGADVTNPQSKKQANVLFNKKNMALSKVYPFRLLEDDSIVNYIYKIQRQYEFSISGWNHMILYDTIYPDQISQSSIQNQRECKNKLDIIDIGSVRTWSHCFVDQIKCFDVTEKEPKRSDEILTVLTWDLEVYMKDCKFDADGSNPENKIICVCGSFGSLKAGSQPQYYCITTANNDTQMACNGFSQSFRFDNTEYIVADNEPDMITKFFDYIVRKDPVFISGFNESCFDLPYLQAKMNLFKSTYNNLVPLVKLFTCAFTNDAQQLTQKIIGTKSSIKQGEYCYKSWFNDISKQLVYNLFQKSFVKVSASDNRQGTCFNIPGIISVDTRTLLIKTQKLEKNSLNEYLKANNLDLKLEVDFADMNSAFISLNDSKLNNTAQCQTDVDMMSHVFEYCMYDSEACRLLWIKRNVLVQFIEVAKLSWTPLRCAFNKADGVKVRNMIAYNAYKSGYSSPMSAQSCDMRICDVQTLKKYEKYPGAYVPEPKKGITITPTGALDFASLYPSIIMAHNLSPETIIQQDELQQYDLKHTIVDIHFPEKGNYPSHITTGCIVDRQHQIGIYPTILQSLFHMRKEVKKDMEKLEHQLEHNILSDADKIQLAFDISLLNAKQMAIKVFMNTFYGEAGNQNSPLFDLIIAGGTTTLGQMYIKQVHQFIQDNDCEVVYGDSVAKDEPLLLKDSNGLVHIRRIDEIVSDYTRYPQFKQEDLTLTNKQQSQCDFMVWVDNQWVPIKRVIRHKCKKHMFRVITSNSVVDVTEDHSLINTMKEQIKPTECEIGITQLHQSYPQFDNVQQFPEFGNFIDDVKNVNSELPNVLKQAFLDGAFFGFTYHKSASLMNKLIKYIEANHNPQTDQIREYDEVSVSSQILNGSYDERYQFFAGFYGANGLQSMMQLSHQSKLVIQTIYYVMKSLGLYCSINIHSDYKTKYTITLGCVDAFNNKLMNIIDLGIIEDYVYDLETEIGLFSAGIGELTLKNTDSVYFKPRYSHYAKQLAQADQLDSDANTMNINESQDEDQIISDCKAIYDHKTIYDSKRKHGHLSMQVMLLRAFDIAEELKKQINEFVGKQTYGFLRMEFEELLCPSMFTGKKKYCGVVYKPGNLNMKHQLTQKDILLKGIDFIKSQYPQIIKDRGHNTILQIMQHFNQQLLDNPTFEQYQSMFNDNYRNELNKSLIDIVVSNVNTLNEQLMRITCDQYGQLSSKKKIRHTKTGDMRLFSDRLDIGAQLMELNNNANMDYLQLLSFNQQQVMMSINPDELQSLGIPIPKQGDLLDIIYISTQLHKAKASQKMHMLNYAMTKQLPIDKNEYLNMFKTTGSRIIVCCCYENDLTASNQLEVVTEAEMQEEEKNKLDEPIVDDVQDSKEQDKLAMRIAKTYFKTIDPVKVTQVDLQPLQHCKAFNNLKKYMDQFIAKAVLKLPIVSIKKGSLINTKNTKKDNLIAYYKDQLNIMKQLFPQLYFTVSLILEPKLQDLLQKLNKQHVMTLMLSFNNISMQTLTKFIYNLMCLQRLLAQNKTPNNKNLYIALQQIITTK